MDNLEDIVNELIDKHSKNNTGKNSYLEIKIDKDLSMSCYSYIAGNNEANVMLGTIGMWLEQQGFDFDDVEKATEICKKAIKQK